MKYDNIPNLRHLSLALHVSQTQSFTAASSIANLSPSAITQAMRGLEHHLTTPIFDRRPTGTYPNDVGKMFLNRVERAFRSFGKAETALGLDQRAGVIQTHISLSQLKAFIEVCRAGSYRLAARRLGLSQPSVHKAARSVEIVLGLPLFRPSSSGVDPTPSAIEFARFASIALSDLERAREEVFEYLGRAASRLAIGLQPIARGPVISNAISILLKQYPNASVRIYDGAYTDLLSSLRYGDLDLLLGTLRDPLPANDIEQTFNVYSETAIIARKGHPLTQKKPLLLSDLASFGWVVEPRGSISHGFFEKMFEPLSSDQEIRKLECGSIVSIRPMLMEGDWVALLSPHQVQYEMEKGDLVIVENQFEGPRYPIGITTRLNWLPTGIQAKFLSILDSQTSKLISDPASFGHTQRLEKQTS